MDKNKVIETALLFKPGSMSRGELECLYDNCKDIDIIELGSLTGMSSFVIASVCKSLKCIDLWSESYDHLNHDQKQKNIYLNWPNNETKNTEQHFIENCKEFIDSGKIKMFKGTTESQVINFQDKSFDAILIDADHSYFGISNDYKNYNTKIKDNGFIIFHDYGDGMWVDIKRFCDEMVNSGKFQTVLIKERIAIFRKVI